MFHLKEENVKHEFEAGTTTKGRVIHLIMLDPREVFKNAYCQ